MKLCIIANAASVHTRRWIAPLLECGYRVHLVSYACCSDSIPSVEITDLTRLTNAPKARFFVWAWWLRRYIKNIEPDVLHAHQIQAAGWLGAMSRFHPLVVSSWGSDLLLEPHKSMFRHALVQWVLRVSDQLIVPSTLMVRAAKELGYPEAKLRCIPWGVETEVFNSAPMDHMETRLRLGIDAHTKVILSPRGIAPVYNHDVLIEAVHDLTERFPSLVLLMLRFNVDPHVSARLESMIAEFNLDRHVRWLPPQTPSEMAQLYRMADVVVSIPSSEGYGFSVYEAMAAGCPTIISDLPVFNDELIDGVHTLKVPVRNPTATRQRLAELLDDATLRQILREQAFEVVKPHDVSHRVAATEEMYRELVSRRHNSRK